MLTRRGLCLVESSTHRSTLFARASGVAVHALGAVAVLARKPHPAVLTNAATPTVDAQVAHTTVLARASALALHALVLLLPVHAVPGTVAVLARIPHPVVLTNTLAPAVLALRLPLVVWAKQCLCENGM